MGSPPASPANAEPWALWRSREILLSMLGRQEEAQAAHARYRASLEAIANIGDEPWIDTVSRRTAVERRHGTTDLA
jgi:hypothetical protein